MAMSKIKLITFDVMNTILRTRLTIGEEYSAMARKFKLNVDPARVNKEFPKVFKGLWDVQPNFGAAKGISSKNWWTSVVQATFHRSGLDLDDRETFGNSIAAADALFEHYSTPSPWMLIGDYTNLLTELRKGRQLGIISNFDQRLEKLLTDLGVRGCFDFVIVSQMAKVCKPFPAIFDMALDKAGLTNGSDALHVGDNIRLDYKAAKDAGWNAVWLCKDHDLLADYPVDRAEVISDLGELANVSSLRTSDNIISS